MPPGAIGSQQLLRGGPLPGYFQPVEIRVPEGATISPAVNGAFAEPEVEPLKVGFLIGSVYRLRVTNIPLQEGLELYPTVEVIDRLFPPLRQEHRFPIPIEITQEDLELALSGRFVTRVIYVEDPESALPVAEDPEQQTFFEVGRGENPLEVADRLGRPMAILRLGGRVPDETGPDAAFLYGSPPFLKYFKGGETLIGEPCDPLSISQNSSSRRSPLSRTRDVVRGQDGRDTSARSPSKKRHLLSWGAK
jgi:hypothetical protein